MITSVRLGLIMAPVCEINVFSSRNRKNDSAFSFMPSSAIETLKHCLRGFAPGDPRLLLNSREIETNAINSA